MNKGTVVDSDGAIEPGKPYDRGRNWTSVVIEVIPGFLESVSSGFNFGRSQSIVSATDEGPDGELEEDDDVIEIPIFVRLEFEADVHAEERRLGDSRGGQARRRRERRRFGRWLVLGV